MMRVQVLSTPGCAGCDQVKRSIAKVLIELPGIDWEEVDLTEHPELVARYGIMSVPAVVIDGRLELAHVPKEGTLRRKIQAASERR